MLETKDEWKDCLPNKSINKITNPRAIPNRYLFILFQ